MKRKFRRKNYVLEAEQLPGGDWNVFDGGKIIRIVDSVFREMFEEVSPLHRIAPLEISPEGAD